jgi:hypothetical protein
MSLHEALKLRECGLRLACAHIPKSGGESPTLPLEDFSSAPLSCSVAAIIFVLRVFISDVPTAGVTMRFFVGLVTFYIASMFGFAVSAHQQQGE